MDYQEYLPLVKSYVRSHVKDRDDAQDIVSDITAKLVAKSDKFDNSKASLGTWIYTITRNTVCDYYRRSSVRSRRVELDKVNLSEEKNLFKEENLEALHYALFQLQERERNVIILRFYHGYEPKEIAGMMNLSYMNVCVIQHRAIDKLKQSLSRL